MSETTRTEAESPVIVDVSPGPRNGTTVITRRFVFDAAHYLPRVPEGHKCRRMHGHTYEIKLHVTGCVDPTSGWIVDFGEIKKVWKPLKAVLDHRLLNEVEGLENPTAENLAAWIWTRLHAVCRECQLGFNVAAVEVAETADSSALFVAPGLDAWVPGYPSVPLRTNGEADAGRPEQLPRPLGIRPDRSELEDVQSRHDPRGIALDEVGVTRVRIPITVLDRSQGQQATVAQVTMAADLSGDVKGTHLSRFMEVLRARGDALTLFSLGDLAAELRRRLNANRCRVRVEFPYFITKAAPVTGTLGEFDLDCAFEVVHAAATIENWLEVKVPVTTVCPCSRDISDYGAHNQRGIVDIRVRCVEDEAGLPALVWIEELVEIAESAASSPVYPVVKRPDERQVTMAGYDHPQFVEDVVRDVALTLSGDDRIASFRVKVENQESIHAHNAFAIVSSDEGI